MSLEESPRPVLTKSLRWTILAILALLFIAAVAGIFGPFLMFLSLGFLAVGVIALIRGRLPSLKISNRRTATGVVIFGVYLIFLGAATSMHSGDGTPVATATGDPCEVVGAINEQETETYYCTPSSSGDLVWADEADFTTYQEEEIEELEKHAQEKAAAATELLEADVAELEKDLVAAEDQAEEAASEITDLEKQLEEQKTATAKAEEEAEAAQAEADRASQPAPSRSAPAPAPSRSAPAPAPSRSAPAPAPTPQSQDGVTAPYENCTAARDAGAAPVLRGEPGYGPHLDRDGDGIGCE